MLAKRSEDGICHVMRAFEDDDVIHAEDTVDPATWRLAKGLKLLKQVRDINTICAELRLKDISSMKGKAGENFSCANVLFVKLLRVAGQ